MEKVTDEQTGAELPLRKISAAETRRLLLGAITIRPKVWRDLTADWQERARRLTQDLRIACSLTDGATETEAFPNQVQDDEQHQSKLRRLALP